MASLAIGSRMVGDGYPPLVIAEIGINHEGSLEVAIDTADAAIDAGTESSEKVNLLTGADDSGSLTVSAIT